MRCAASYTTLGDTIAVRARLSSLLPQAPFRLGPLLALFKTGIELAVDDALAQRRDGFSLVRVFGRGHTQLGDKLHLGQIERRQEVVIVAGRSLVTHRVEPGFTQCGGEHVLGVHWSSPRICAL